ncbi:DUF4331 family protein [Candidatus Marithrix sp. Canyon 246]|uniref:DUF4331 family protein n=1 Tax=Candidatus Marithrix sp. Canyon 246 TaxID=1827136 RepID=UPI001C0D1A99|nr:DUF4331 family protein [Candidatus Marithrix sp. Canyon 246]
MTSLAIEVPTKCLIGDGKGIIGAWTTASLPQIRLLNPQASFAKPAANAGKWVQVSRLPKDDGQFATYVTHPTLPALVNILNIC